METQEFMAKIRNVQKQLLDYLTDEENIEENFKNLKKLLINHIQKGENEFRLILHLINNISYNHSRTKDYILKFENILSLFTEEFKKYLSNSEIYNIFKENKRILYFLFENKIIVPNEYVANDILRRKKKNYPIYFIKEISPFVSKKILKEINDESQKNNIDPTSEYFDTNRKKGQNEQTLCELIRNDSIDEFITYVAQEDISLNTTIKPSIFETNPILSLQSVTMLQYAAFFGSVQIFKYLFLNEAEVKKFLWIYSIHSNNPELIHYLIENNVEPEDKTYKICYTEAILCHHNEIASYIKDNFIHEENEIFELKCIEYYNFMNISDQNLFNRNTFLYLCEYDYFFLIEQILKNKSFDVDYKIKDIGTSNSYCSFIATPLIGAIMNDNANIVKILLEHQEIDLSANLTKCTWSKFEITHSYMFCGVLLDNPKIANYLINSKGIDINSKSFQKIYKPNNVVQIIEEFPITEVISNKSYDILKILLNNPNIDLSVEKKNYYSSPNSSKLNLFKKMAPLSLAIMMNDIDIIKLLLSCPKIDVNTISKNNISESEFDEPPLFFAVRINKEQVVKLLLDHPKIDVSIKSFIRKKDMDYNDYILNLAISKRNIEIIKLLLACPQIDVNMNTVQKSNDETQSEIKKNSLISAVCDQQEEIVELLLKCPGIDVNAIYTEDTNAFYSEKSALYIAVEKESEKIVEILLEHSNINVNYKSKYNAKDNSYLTETTILHEAIKRGNYAIIELLLKSPKIDVNLKSYTKKSDAKLIEEEEETTLKQAIVSKNNEIISLLLKRPDIDINLKSRRSSLAPLNYFNEEKTLIQTAIALNDIYIFKTVLDALISNDKFNENLNNLIHMTDNERMKALIYSNISRQKHSF